MRIRIRLSDGGKQTIEDVEVGEVNIYNALGDDLVVAVTIDKLNRMYLTIHPYIKEGKK